MDNKLVEIVTRTIDACSYMIMNFYTEHFNIVLWNKLSNSEITSPIEQLLYCGLYTVAQINLMEKKLIIQPQKEIGKYRADFQVKYKDKNGNETVVLVECDSQEWHERTERERRYEKARDRFFTKQGYKVFHYTGKEIKDNLFKIAVEIIAYLSDIEEKDLLEELNQFEGI